MDGVHDLGGMHGFGPVEWEPDEPPFHASWEAVMVAINEAGRRRPLYNIDEFRHAIERMDPASYFARSYFERWLDGISRLLQEKGVVTAEQLDARTRFFLDHPDAPAAAAMPEAPRERSGQKHGAPATFRRTTTAPPHFAPGDPVITRNVHPRGHTRLPRYARGKSGVVDRVHGVFVFPDTNAHGRGEQPQAVYSVRFAGRELWGESAEPGQTVYLDLWESYLLPG